MQATVARAGWTVFLTLLVMLAVMAASPRPREAEQRRAMKGGTLLVGPLRLGELYAKMGDKKEYDELIPRGGGPSKADIMQALNECKLSIVDQRTKGEGKDKWEFCQLKDEPRIVLEGTFSFDLKDKRNKEFQVHVEKVTYVDYTDIETLGVAKGAPPTRWARLAIHLRTSPYQHKWGKPGKEITVTLTGLNFITPSIFWDVTGKVRLSEKLLQEEKEP